MARINIEESWWTDERRFALADKLGSLHLADGLMIEVWRLSQTFWADGKKRVPSFLFKQITNHELIVECRLAVTQGETIYVSGSRQYHHWILERKEASAKGGKSNRNHAKQTGSQTPSKREANGEPSLLLSLSSFHKDLNTIAHPLAERVIKIDSKLEEIYQSYPRKLGKSAGMKKLKTQIKTENDIENLKSAIQNFVKYLRDKQTEPNFIPYFSTFVTSWRDWLESDTGKTALTAGKPPQDDDYIKQLEQIRRQS